MDKDREEAKSLQTVLLGELITIFPNSRQQLVNSLEKCACKLESSETKKGKEVIRGCFRALPRFPQTKANSSKTAREQDNAKQTLDYWYTFIALQVHLNSRKQFIEFLKELSRAIQAEINIDNKFNNCDIGLDYPT